MCLPLRSILSLRPSFFEERGRSSFSGGALDAGESARFSGIFFASAFFSSDGVPPFVPAQVTQTVGAPSEVWRFFQGESPC